MKQISDIKVASSDEDREQIFRFRYDVYVTEMGKSPAEADHQKKIIRDELDEDAHLLYAENDDANQQRPPTPVLELLRAVLN